MDYKVSAAVFYSGCNFSAYLPILPGCIATGDTPTEVNKRLIEAVAFHVKSSLEVGDDIPEVFKGHYELVYKYDAEGLLNYKGIFTKTELKRLTGINSKQVHHYASGTKKPRRAQIEKLENAFHELGRELIEVKL